MIAVVLLTIHLSGIDKKYCSLKATSKQFEKEWLMLFLYNDYIKVSICQQKFRYK